MSTTQKLSALAVANHIRSEIARTKNELRALSSDEACRHAARLLVEELEGPLASSKVHPFLVSVRGVGQSKAAALCRRAGVSPASRLGSLTDRQVSWLAGELLDQANRFEVSRADYRRKRNGS